MKELFDLLQKVSVRSVEYYLDTCFLFFIIQHHLEKRLLSFCESHTVAVSSFTIEEFLFHHHDMLHEVKVRFRYLLRHGLSLYVVDIPVSPGHPDAERSFVKDVDHTLPSIIPDPSDAVLFALALSSGAGLLTRDRHHLFTSALENYSSSSDIPVYNNFPES